MNRQHLPRDAAGSQWLAIGLALLTVSATVWALAAMTRVGYSIPQARIARINDAETLFQLEQNAVVAAGIDVKDAWTTRWVSQEFFQLLLAPNDRMDDSTLNMLAQRVTGNHLGRLQLALANALLAERTGVEPTQTWGRVNPLLDGLTGGEFRHHTRALVERVAASYSVHDVGSGTARELAEMRYIGAHGVFLQYAVKRLGELAESGDERRAHLCRTVARRLMRQWILEAGPAALRLLAADLLARELAGDDSLAPLVAELREFREKYRVAAASRPQAVLGLHGGPTLTPAHDAYLQAIARVTWTTSAALACGIVALLLGPSALRRGGLGRLRARSVLVALGAALALVLIGQLFIGIWTELIRSDIRSDFKSLRYAWKHPFIAVLAAWIVLPAAARFQPSAAPRLALTAWWTTLCLSLAAVLLSARADVARSAYETQLAAALKDDYAALVGGPPEEFLHQLRGWQP